MLPFLSVHRKLFGLAVLFLVFFQNCGQPGAISSNSIDSSSLANLVHGAAAGEFTCQTVVLLPASATINIPARSANGTCYAVKLFDAIAQSASSLTTQIDYEVVSRDHDSKTFATRNPYLLGRSFFDLILEGPRKVKLSGGLSVSTQILVDNFVLVGIYPLGAQPRKDFYKSFGTKDSTIDAGETFIGFRNDQIPLQPFASAGTATVTPLEIITDLQTNTGFTVDIRALDCGGARALSDVYALFQ